MKKLLLIPIFFIINFAVFANNLIPEIKTPKTQNIKSMMLVGNSFFYYNNSLHKYLGDLVKHDISIEDLKRRSITINGSALSWHDVGSYLDNPHIGSFKIDANNDNKYVPYPDTTIDIVIMMGCSLCPIHPARKLDFQKYTREHSATIRSKGSEPMLFMSWSYKNKPEMFIDLKKAFIETANANNLLLIPVGEAFYKFHNVHPEIDLYTSDLRHPSKEGTYMAAAVIFSTLYGKSTFGNIGIMNLKPEDAKKIQKIADQTVEEFFQLTLK